MSTIEEIENYNKIDENEVNTISRKILGSFLTQGSLNHTTIVKQEILLDDFMALLGKYLQLDFYDSSQDKIELINFIDKLNIQKELLELKKGQTNLADIEAAGERLGKKAQSAFESK